MMTSPPKFNRLDWLLSAGVPSAVVAGVAVWRDASLADSRLIPVMLCLGFGLGLLNPTVTAVMKKIGLQHEVLLQAVLRLVLSMGCSFVCAEYFLR